MIIDCAHYRAGERQNEGKLPLAEAAKHCHSDDDFVWLGLREPSIEELEEVGEIFGLHALALEDAVVGHQRPKLEDYGDSLFMVLRTARYDDAKEEVEFGEIHIFLGPGYLIAIRHGEGSELAPARKQLEQHPDLLKAGPDAVLWAILDKVVDDYSPVVEGLEHDIEEVEQEIFGARTDSTERIYFLKREVIEFHRAVFPMLVPLEGLVQGNYPQVGEEVRRYIRDVADHARRVDELITSDRELLTSILEANLALLGVQQNEVVRSISAWAAIIGVPTFFASIWGMNFEHMPELSQTWAYPAALIWMVVTVFILYRFFKRISWL